MQKVYLNIVPGGVVPDINVSQFDSGRTFQLAVMDGGVAADLTGLSVSVSGQKPDSFGFYYTEDDMVGAAHVVSVSGNIVTITTPVQMTAADGRVVCWLSLTDSDDNEISTLYFDMHVQRSPLVGVIISETELPAIIALAQQQEENAEAWAMGIRGGVPVSSDDPAYHNNSKYYADLAASAATGVLEKYPKIVSDYWYIWDVDQDDYVNTGVKALGEDGATGATPDITMSATVDNNTGTPGVTVTESGTPENPAIALAFTNLKGAPGATGATPNITMSATVDANTGTPAVTVTKSGTAENPTFALAFSNLKGEPGGGGGGGHTIYNGSGTAMADEDGLQFEGGLDVTDDSVGQKTVVSAGKKIAWADAEGFVGKNLLQNMATNDSQSAVVYTIGADGSVALSGTASANVSIILNADLPCESGVAYTVSGGYNALWGSDFQIVIVAYSGSTYVRNLATVATTDGAVSFTPDFSDYDTLRFTVWIKSGTPISTTIYPMIRYADITDDTYEPWIPKNTELVRWTEQNVLGAKNLLKVPDKTASSNDYTVSCSGGVFSTSGTASANTSLNLLSSTTLSTELKAVLTNGANVRLTMHGDTYNVSTLNVCLQYKDSSNVLHNILPNGNMYTIPAGSTFYALAFYLGSGVTSKTATFTLMLRLATVEDDTYEPYALTNRAITEVGAILDTDVYSSITGSYDLDNFKSAGALLCTAANAASVTHKPYVSDEDFVVYNMHLFNNSYRQLYISRADHSGIWTRIFNGSSWTSWVHNLTNIDVGSAAMVEVETTVTYANDKLPTGNAVLSLVNGLEILHGPLTGYVGDTTLTFTSVGYKGNSGPLMSFYSSNTSGKPVTIKTAVYDDVQDTATITFDALTEQTLFVMVINNTY